MPNSRARNIAVITMLIVLCTIETLSFTYFKLLPAFAESNAIVYLLSGMGIVALAMIYSFMNDGDVRTKGKVWYLPQILLALAVLAYLGVLYAQYGNNTYPNFPIFYKYADMLPLIKRACQQFVEGKDVYQSPLNEPGYWPNSYIPYLPAMWMPFVPTYLLQVDIRWTVLVASFLVYCIVFLFVARLPLSKASIALPVFSVLFFVNTRYFTWEDRGLYFSLTQEAVPAFFYLVLFIALMLRKGWLVAIALALCTLSRYSVVLFVPVYFLFLLIDKDYKAALRFVIIYAGLIAALFIFPFFIKRPQFFIEITQKYQAFEEPFWAKNLDGTKPQGDLGLVYLVGYDLTILKLMKPIMLALIAIFSAAWLALYYKFKGKLVANKEIWLMAGFKMALLLFYNFISMPFSYLFIVPTVISYPILLAIIRKTDLSKHKTT